MAKLYVIVDTKMKVDTFVFLQQNDGAAASYFYNWCLLQQHRDFYLASIAEIVYIEDEYRITSVERDHICDMPKEDSENG